jgi:drug/metabolite transporter (DMT)-like permease
VVVSGSNATPRSLIYGALLLVQVFFGLHYLAAKPLLREIPPAAWALMRVAGAAVLLLFAVRLLGRRLPRSRRILGRLALYSVFGVVLNQLCFVEGLSRTTPAHASILMSAIPVGALLFAVLARRERLTGIKIGSFVTALVGVLLVLRPTGEVGGEATLTGDLLIVTNALSYSLFLVLSKDLLERVDPLAATAVLLGFGSVGMLVPGLPALATLEFAAISSQTWALGIFIVVFPTALGYHLNYWALARVESSLVAFFIYLQPLIATSLSVVFLGERLTPTMLAGAALVFVAVFLVLRPRPPRKPPATRTPPRKGQPGLS